MLLNLFDSDNIIFIPIIVVALLGLYILLPKRNGLSGMSESKKRELSQQLELFQEIVNNHNNTVQAFYMRANHMRDEINEYRDEEALSEFISIIEEFGAKQQKSSMQIDHINDMIKRSYFRGLDTEIALSDDIVCNMQSSFEALKEIRIEDNRYFKGTYDSRSESDPQYANNETYGTYEDAHTGSPEPHNGVLDASSTYFAGIKDKEALTKRYKALAKAFHPDNGFGDPETFDAITKEYEELKEML